MSKDRKPLDGTITYRCAACNRIVEPDKVICTECVLAEFNEAVPDEWVVAASGADRPVRDALVRWMRQGRGVAIYQNQAMDSKEFGRLVYLTYGSADAQIEGTEPPQRMPDVNVVNTPWAFQLTAHLAPRKVTTARPE